jgi:glucose/arabinose dehydrogenase
MRRRDVLLAVAGLVLMVSSGGCARPATPPPSTSTTATPPASTAAPRIALEPAWSGFSQPVQLANAGDGSGRLFVVQLGGSIRVIEGGRVLATPLLDISRLVSTGGERGLLGMAFEPGHPDTFYVDYTDINGDSVIARYRVSSTDRNIADPASADTVLKVAQPFPNHNGGQLAFGPDGFLYIGFGDGGGAGDPNGNGQNPAALLGKILRIGVSGTATYTIPADNPFVTRHGFRPEIWDLGLRNPWRFSFDTANGDLYIGDVGQNLWEEIDYEPARTGGLNYGWNRYEGLHTFKVDAALAPGTTAIPPVAEYGHDQGEAVIGGFVYRGSRWPSLAGAYLYGDYSSGRVWALTRQGGSWRSEVAADTGRIIGGFGQAEDGELYLLDLRGGDVLHVVAR